MTSLLGRSATRLVAVSFNAVRRGASGDWWWIVIPLALLAGVVGLAFLVGVR
jgi:hypothetical protein